MLNKPFILTLLVTTISFVFTIILGLIFRIIGLDDNSIPSVALAMLAAIYVGQIYSNKYKVELSKSDKIKIAIYYLLIQMLMTFGYILFLHGSKLVAQIVVASIFLNILSSVFIYVALGRGCKVKLKQLESISR